jgi:ABC-type uncharacterized transport system involved in gliding motility auxiliary subunit
MRKAIDFLAPLGLVVIIGSTAWERSGRTLPGKPDAYLMAGAALILAHVLLRWDEISKRVGRRQMKYGANTAVLVAVVIGILGAVNYLVYRHTKRWDLTKNQRYSLSDQTKKVLGGLKEDVKVTYFQRGVESAAGKDRMREYETASRRVKVEFVDPIKSPTKAMAYEVRGPWPILVVERGGKREKVSNDSEQDVTNALIKVTRDTKKTVCFVEGEGERDIDDGAEAGFSAVKSALGKSQYETKKVLLAREPSVPADCTVMVVAGPQHDLLPTEIDALRRFAKGGGKVLLMAEPELKNATPNLDALAKEWNVELGKDIVVDVSPASQLFGTGPLTPIAASYPYHEITKDFRVMTAFHTARSAEAGKGTVEGVTAQSIVQTAPASWAETDLTLKEPIEMNEGKDRKGPISLGAAATIKASPAASPSPPAASPAPSASPSGSPSPRPEPSPPTDGRVVVFGDSDFASNALLGFQGNQDFFLNTVAWLARDPDLISIRPKEAEDQRMFLTRQQQQNVFFVALLLIPGAFVVMGIAAWWRRRE